MTRIAEVLSNRRVLSVEAEQTVLEAARYMTEFNIGAVPVLRAGELVGIFSERDIMRRVVSGGRSPAITTVAEVMTPRPLTLSPDDTLEQARFVMLEHGFRHLPVVAGKQLTGIVSLRDVLPSGSQQAKAS
jgi:CBS domain-containing protein